MVILVVGTSDRTLDRTPECQHQHSERDVQFDLLIADSDLPSLLLSFKRSVRRQPSYSSVHSEG